ncbi:aminoglycoside phosphotransferase (APT) family kinase protein [Devosia sp. UYZn731]|uniref:aminoglycoside phosphotransferase family protein n=1 Tax=Devosia sp. UYZn731 TaxID=3156345 RepID=UPI00339B4BC7
MKGMPQQINAKLVQALLHEQHPDLAELPITFGAFGWDNQMWRLGEDLAVRLPWSTEGADELLLKEYVVLPAMALRLPLPIPVPERLGSPSVLFPRTWIVTSWVHGEPADRAPVTRGIEAAAMLAAFLAALHQAAPGDAPISRDRRGGSLAAIQEGFLRSLQEAVDRQLIPDADEVRRVWDDAVAAPAWAGPLVWLHADLHPANVLTKEGNFCGIIDFGDMCAGDPSCDLSAAWLLLPDGMMDHFHARYAPALDAATIRRARGWALSKALVCLVIGDNGVQGKPGGKATWGPPGKAAIQRLIRSQI